MSQVQNITADTASPTVTSRAGPGAWCALASMALVYLVIGADVSVLALAVPELSADLTPSGGATLWILHVAEFAGASAVVTCGLLTTRLGRRRLLVAGAAVIGTALTVAAFAPDPGTLIAARMLLGLGTAAYTPAALSLVRLMFTDRREFTTAFALLLGAFSGGMALGPLLGGVLLERFWWGSVFLAGAAPAALLIVLAPFLVPRDAGDPAVRIDAVSVVLSVAAVPPLVHGLQRLADAGPDVPSVASGLVGLVLLGLFLRRQRRIAHPLLDLALFAGRRFRIVIVVLAVAMLWPTAATVFVAQFLQIVRDLTPLQAGLVLAVPAAAGLLGTLASPVLQRAGDPIRIVPAALAASGLAAGATAALLPVADPVLTVLLLSAVAACVSLVLVLTSQLIVTGVPESRTGSATAVQDLVAGASIATGIALLGTLAHAAYRAALGRVPVPGVPAEVLADAAGTPAAGSGAADALTGRPGAGLAGAVDAGLTQATQVVHLAGAVVSLLVAGAVAFAVRRDR